MKRLFVFFALPVLAVLAGQVIGQDARASASDTPAAASAAAESAAATQATASASPARVERGRYLVEGVGMCAQCHTPRNDVGELLEDQWLQGAAVPVTSPAGFRQVWAHQAPRIAGLPQHTDEEFVRLMTTGINRDGKETLGPMPPFRMSEDDALAIAAYLRSL